jgi:hypothetical protein
MGLLDLNLDDPQQAGMMSLAQGLLAAGAPQTRRVGLGEALAGGMGNMMQARQQAKGLQQQSAANDLAMKMKQFQFSGMQQDAQARQAQQEFQSKLPEIIRQYGNDYQGMIRDYPAAAEYVKQVADARNLGLDKVARVEDVAGANGEKMRQMYDDFGRPISQAVKGYVAPQLVDLNDSKQYVIPTAGQSFKVGMSPQDRDASARGWAGIALQKEQANKPTWNNEVGAFILPPSKQNPQGAKIDLAGFTKPEKPLTEVQAKAVTFASRMKNANEIINDLSSKGIDKSSAGKQFLEAVPVIGGGLGNLYNTKLDEGTQKLDQAKRDWVNANLRNESGAAIGKDEFSSADKQYFPQIGDKPEVIQQKAINRKLAEEGMRSQAGAGAKNIDSIVSGSKTSAPTQKVKMISLDGGGSATARLGADGNYYVERNGKKYRVEE